jgi:hypothetical protein
LHGTIMYSRREFCSRLALAGAGLATVQQLAFGVTKSESPYLAFKDSSEWNTPIPPNAPVDPSSEKFIAHIKGFNSRIQWPTLAIGKWGEPFYWAKAGDPWYEIPGFPVPKVRIPHQAEPAPNSDSELTVFDLEMGWVIKLTKATFDGTWHTFSKTWYSLSSNGLEGRVAESDEKRNQGHRGFPPSLHGVRWDEIEAGSIRHTLKVSLDKTGEAHAYPASGHERHRGGIVPEGAVFRIKPSVDLNSRGLKGAALVIATAMQRYGIVVGDTGGVPMSLKLEALETEKRKERWSEVGLDQNSFSAIRFDDMECVQLGYHRRAK